MKREWEYCFFCCCCFLIFPVLSCNQMHCCPWVPEDNPLFSYDFIFRYYLGIEDSACKPNRQNYLPLRILGFSALYFPHYLPVILITTSFSPVPSVLKCPFIFRFEETHLPLCLGYFHKYNHILTTPFVRRSRLWVSSLYQHLWKGREGSTIR